MKSPLSILGSNSTKENIIELLSAKWPLSAKKIHNILKKDYKLSLTYQATHKSLKELTQNNILEKSKQGYGLNKEWVKDLGEISGKIISDLENKDKKRQVKTFHKLIFKNHADFIKFHMKFMAEAIEKEKKLNMIFYFRHVPAPNSLSNEDIGKLKSYLSKIKWKIISKCKTPLDKWNATFWKKIGVKVDIGKDIPTDSRLIIMNDYIINVYSSKKDLEVWDTAYEVKKIRDFNAHKITEGLLSKRHKTIITITKDKEIANLLK